MKKYYIIFIILNIISCKSQTQGDCVTFKAKTGQNVGEWHIVYNKFYNQYAIMRIDSTFIGTSNEKEFLVKNHFGEYGVYGFGWWDCNGGRMCGDKYKSLFKTPCEAKQYLITYIKKLKEDKWE